MKEKFDLQELLQEVRKDEAAAVSRAPLLSQKDINRLLEEHRRRKGPEGERGHEQK